MTRFENIFCEGASIRDLLKYSDGLKISDPCALDGIIRDEVLDVLTAGHMKTGEPLKMVFVDDQP